MKRRGFVFIFIFILFILIFLGRGYLVGGLLEPILEKTLTRLFGMPVSIQELYADPLTGRVRALHITFLNQPEFATKPHLDAQGLQFRIDFPALLRKEVLIDGIDLYRPFYFIDRIATPHGPRNNVSTWVHHIRGDDKKDASPESSPKRDWRVVIRQISLHEGTFLIHDRSHHEGERKFFFDKLNGDLIGFEWPARNPEQLTQKVRMEGMFGSQYPAPFWIEGNANFATSQVNFDLKGEIQDGKVLEHRHFWENLPIDVKDGRFHLKMHVTCKRRHLNSINILRIKSIKASPGPEATDKIWGLPVIGFIGFVQSQKTMTLTIPVKGYISDPEFEFPHAFRTAFQKALQVHTVTGIKKLTGSTAKIAVQTGGLVRETPTRLAEGLGKISTAVKEQVPPLSGVALNQEKKESVRS